MQTLTLHPLSPNWKPRSFPSTSSSSPVIWKNSIRSSLRYFRQWARHANRDKILLRQFEQASSSHMHGTEPWFFAGDSGKISTGCEEIILAKHLMNRFPACYTVACGSCRNRSFNDDKALRSLKLALLLIGMLASQGSHQAIAGTEFSGEPQLISFIGDLGDISTGFASAFLLIFFSELGDKTFFIAALLAARNSGAVVFIGTFGALAAMSIVSVLLGRTFHYVDGILPFRFGETDFPIDDFAAVCLLVYFGITTLLEAASGDGLKIKEEQKEAEVAVSELSGNGAGTMAAASTVMSTFLLVFVAEWGDKSFFSTIALAAASSPLGVIGGAFAGHALATLLAVVGGSILGTFVSEKVVAYIGGSLFLLFAVITLIEIVN